jgi:hypothetical protein
MCKHFFIYCALRGFEPMTSRWMYTLYSTCGSGNYSFVWESMDYESKIRISKLQMRLEAGPASYHPLLWSKYYSLLIQCSFFHSGTRLNGCHTVRHSGIYIYIYIYMYTYKYMYSVRICIRICTYIYVDLFMQHGPGQWTCMDAGMLIKGSVRHR